MNDKLANVAGSATPPTQAELSAWDQFKLIQDSTLRVWAIYMQWFTWFFGTELISMALLVNQTKDNAGSIKAVGWIVAYLWIFSSALGLGGATAMALYTISVFRRLRQLWAQIPNTERQGIRPLVPMEPTLAAAVGNALALSAGIVAWILVLRYQP